MKRHNPNTTSLLHRALAVALTGVLACPLPVWAGGPLAVGSPTAGTSGVAIVWDAAQPVTYRVDGGPLATNPSGTVIIDNAAATTIVQGMFQVWENVPTASVRFANGGAIQSVPPNFTDGDVSSAFEFNSVVPSCEAGTQSPIIFDANGDIFAQLIGDPSVIGFAGLCKVDDATGKIVTGAAVLNGRFRDGINSGSNFELTADQFEEVFVHEFGHFLGLDHSQINQNVLSGSRTCAVDELAGLPLMFPVLYCQARKSAGLSILGPDDRAWISKLYPETASGSNQTPFASAYGFISGKIFFSDGLTQAQGINVIARQISDGNSANGNESRRVTFSVVSGFLFTGNPGQNVTTNNPGSVSGSRDGNLIGTYEIPVVPGTYTVEVESVRASFGGGSSVGPVDPPIANPGPAEFWDNGESATDLPSTSSPIAVTAGATISNINIILNGTPPRFDAFESAELRVAPTHWLALPRREQLLSQPSSEEARA
jgi:hypothetical protein